MRTDTEIERDVREELRWDPRVDATDIAVVVKDGVVTLADFVKRHIYKYEAEIAAKRIAGMAGIANDLEVRLPALDERPDPEIARDGVATIKGQAPILADKIKVVTKNGWVVLEGTVEWQYQRDAVEDAVRRLKGVKGVTNAVVLRPCTEPTDIKMKIQEALMRSAEIDAKRVIVEANGGEIILKGSVRSWIEREEAERVARAAPWGDAGGRPHPVELDTEVGTDHSDMRYLDFGAGQLVRRLASIPREKSK